MKTAWSLVMLLPLFANAAAPFKSQLEINREACQRESQAEREMNRIFNQVLHANQGDDLFVTRLRAAQAAWLKYRDAEFEARFPVESGTDPAKREQLSRDQYGSVFPMCRCRLLEELDKERSVALRKWLKPTAEGETCSGSLPGH